MSNGKSRACQTCPNQKGTLAVLLTRSDTQKAIAGAAVSVKGPTPGSASTDALGAAVFTGRAPGAYTTTVALPNNYRMTRTSPGGSVSPDSTTTLSFAAAPVGHLYVEVFDDRGQLVTRQVTLSAAGPVAASQGVTSGSHTFAALASGQYEVSAAVPAEFYERPSVTKPNVAVPEGGTARVRLEVKRLINVVTPKIEMEYRVVMLDRKLYAHQDAAETKIVTDDVTTIQVSAAQNAGRPAYTGHGTFEVSPANVEVYLDPQCKNALAGRKIDNRDLVSGSFKLYLKAKTKGKFTAKLTLDPSNEPAHIEVKGPAQEEMGVVELELKVHRYEKSDLDAISVEPDVHPFEDYYTKLKDEPLPQQKALTDAQKVKDGRLLHAQISKNHARAKVVLKLVADQWPAGTDNYLIALEQQGGGGLTLWDKEWDGTEKAEADRKIKVSALKAKELEFWVQGAAPSKKLRDIVLSVGLERKREPAPHLWAHDPKRNGDWARFSVVKVNEVKVDYTPVAGKAVAWDAAKGRFYINFKQDNAAHDGRKVTIAATLSEKIAGVKLHFMLAPHKDNMKAANWGVDLPGPAFGNKEWKWKDVDAKLKHKDKDDRKKLLHLSGDTDANGVAKKELLLSRFGGDKFHPGAYVDQDPHLAKYIPAHAELKKKKPVLAATPITVWRKFWYQTIKVAGMTYAAFSGAKGQYGRCKATMEAAADLEITKAAAAAFTGTAIYSKYKLILNGGNDDIAVVTQGNKAQFFTGFSAEADKPLKTPIVVCDKYCRSDGNSAARVIAARPRADYPFEVAFDKDVTTPTVQGGNLVVSGKWIAARWDGSAFVDRREGTVADGDITIDPARDSLKKVSVGVPAGVPATATHVRVENLVVQCVYTLLLGGFNRTDQRTVVVYDPAEPADFQNTVAHEVAHSLFLASKKIAGIPIEHQHWEYTNGNHCTYQTDRCVMYQSGPIRNSLNRFCPVCHPYVLVQDMFRLKSSADSANNE